MRLKQSQLSDETPSLPLSRLTIVAALILTPPSPRSPHLARLAHPPSLPCDTPIPIRSRTMAYRFPAYLVHSRGPPSDHQYKPQVRPVPRLPTSDVCAIATSLLRRDSLPSSNAHPPTHTGFAPPPLSPSNLASNDPRTPSPFAFSSAASDASSAPSTAVPDQLCRPCQPRPAPPRPARTPVGCERRADPASPEARLCYPEFGLGDFDGDMSGYCSDSSDGDPPAISHPTFDLRPGSYPRPTINGHPPSPSYDTSDRDAQAAAAKRAMTIARRHSVVRPSTGAGGNKDFAVTMALAQAEQAAAVAMWRMAAGRAMMGSR